MFRRVLPVTDPVEITFEGQTLTAQAGDTVAAALLAAGIAGFRHSAEADAPRGPVCMIGNCFECLVEIEGLGSRQACRTRVADGMALRRHPGMTEPEGTS